MDKLKMIRESNFVLRNFITDKMQTHITECACACALARCTMQTGSYTQCVMGRAVDAVLSNSFICLSFICFLSNYGRDV